MHPAQYIFAGTTPIVAAVAWSMIHPRARLFGPVHSRGNSDQNRYALTFDDGPSDPSTGAILDLLGEMRVTATFFAVGQNVRRCPRLIERIHVEGHIVANHSMDHPYLGMFRGPGYWREQIGQTDALIEQIVGVRPAYFRPPMGVKSWFICGPARRMGHEIITWSRRAMDGIRTTQQAILDRLVRPTVSGDLLMLHDGMEPHRPNRDPSPTIAAIKPLILQLRDRGLEPAPLNEILNLPPYQTTNPAPASAAAIG